MLYIKITTANCGGHNTGLSCDQRIKMQALWRIQLKVVILEEEVEEGDKNV